MPSPVQVGEIIAGKYRVDAVIGQGGMGVVVAATDTVLDRRVAVKFLLPQYAENQAASGRFLREARATARLNSEHAVRIIEVGQLENGSPFMAMEHLQGVDLGTLIERQGALELKVAVDYVLQGARGLAEAHQAGIIHRDVKPSNLFLSHQPSGKPVVKVLDFGVSKLNLGVEASAGSLTTTGQTLGSPLYMSPEQMRSSQHVDARSDIWGLGVVLFELLTGARPFVAEGLAELVLVISQDPPLDPKVLRPDLPDGLCRVILRCLEKDPNRRYANVAEFAADLAQYGSRDSRAAARDINALGSDVKIPGAPPVGRLGTLIVGNADHPDLAQLSRLAESVLGPSNVSPDLSRSLATPGPSAAAAQGSLTSAPWASTNDEPGKAKSGSARKSGPVGLFVAFGAAGVLVVAGGLALFLSSGTEDDQDSDIASAASELANAVSPEAAPKGDETTGAELSKSPSPSAAASLTPSIPAVAPSASAEGSPAPEEPRKKAVRRVRPEEPKSAKERLGF